jgi:hypothetical protein
MCTQVEELRERLANALKASVDDLPETTSPPYSVAQLDLILREQSKQRRVEDHSTVVSLAAPAQEDFAASTLPLETLNVMVNHTLLRLYDEHHKRVSQRLEWLQLQQHGARPLVAPYSPGWVRLPVGLRALLVARYGVCPLSDELESARALSDSPHAIVLALCKLKALDERCSSWLRVLDTLFDSSVPQGSSHNSVEPLSYHSDHPTGDSSSIVPHDRTPLPVGPGPLRFSPNGPPAPTLDTSASRLDLAPCRLQAHGLQLKLEVRQGMARAMTKQAAASTLPPPVMHCSRSWEVWLKIECERAAGCTISRIDLAEDLQAQWGPWLLRLSPDDIEALATIATTSVHFSPPIYLRGRGSFMQVAMTLPCSVGRGDVENVPPPLHVVGIAI